MSYNFGTGLNSSGTNTNSEPLPDISEFDARLTIVEDNIETVLGIGDISVLVSDVNTTKSNLTIQTGRVSVSSNAIVALDIRTSNLEGSFALLDGSLDVATTDIANLEASLEDYTTLSTTQVLTNKTLDFNNNTFTNFPETDLVPIETSINELDDRVDANSTDLINLDLRLDNNEVIINVNTTNIISNSNNISSNLEKINLNSNNIFTFSSNLSTESSRIDTAMLNDIALNIRIDEADLNIDTLDARLDIVEGASNNYLTETNTKTVSNKTFDYNANTFLNFPIGGEGGATGDVTLVGVQTLTNKTMSYSSNTFLDFPTFDDTLIQIAITDLDTRVDEAETDITSLSDFIIINSNNIVGLSNEVTTTIANLPFYNDTDIRSDLTVVEGRVDTVQLDITALDDRLDIVEVAAPTYVTLTGTQTVTNKTIAFSSNTFTGFPTFDDSAIQTELTDLDLRLDNAETDITDTNNAVISANNQIIINSNNIVLNSNNIVSLSNYVSTLSTEGGVGDVIGPTTHSANFIPKWNGTADSKTLVEGVEGPTGAIVGTTDIQTLINKTFDYNNNSFLNFPTGSNSGSNTVVLSNITFSNVTSSAVITQANIGNPYRFRATGLTATGTSAQPTSDYTDSNLIVRFNVEAYDTNNNFDTTTAFRYLVPKSGYYDIDFHTIGTNSGGVTGAPPYYFAAIYSNSIGVVAEFKSAYLSSGSVGITFNPVIGNIRAFLDVGTSIDIRVRVPALANSTYTITGVSFQMEYSGPLVGEPIDIVTTTNVNQYNYSYTGTGNILTGQSNSNNYIPVWSSNNSTFLNNGIDASTVATLTGTQTITGKTMAFADNTFTGFASGDVLLTSSQTLTNKTMDYNSNIFLNFPSGGGGGGGPATDLQSATTIISIGSAIAPSSNMVLKSTSASNAIWDNHYRIFNPYRLNVYTNTGTIATQPSGDSKISTFDNVFLDPMSGWNNTTKRYIIPITGYYRCFANITFSGYSANLRHSIFIKLNTLQIARTETMAPSSTGGFFTMQSDSVFSANANDYIEIWSYYPSGSSKIFNDAGTKFYSYFTMEYLGTP